MKQTKTLSIKGIKIFLTVLTLVLFFKPSFGQMGNGIIFQRMRILGESANHMDVSAAIIKCDSVNQIHLKVFNESNATQDANFELIITNTPTGEHFSRTVTIPAMTPLKIVEGNCSGNPALSGVIINLPPTYNPAKTAIKIIF